MTAVIGLDLSLTCTGAATWVDGTLTMSRLTPKKMAGRARRTYLAEAVADLVTGVAEVWPHLGPPLVVIEAVPTHGHAYNVVKLGELHGVVLHHLNPYRPAYVDPATLKKWATGKGNAGKPAMLEAAQTELGYTGKSADEADAAWLAMLGVQLAGHPGPPGMFTAQRLALLAGVSWPEGFAELAIPTIITALEPDGLATP